MIKKDTCIAYKGLKYTIEWYFDRKGKSQVLEYYLGLTPLERRKVLMLFKRIGDFGKINDKTKFRNEGDKIYAFKPQPNRFLSFFIEGGKIVVTNAFRKKSNKLPKNEKTKAMDYRIDYLSRAKEETYYEK
ncbi:MAG: type II toxin-antitoxin system RelE/ParE family toxin [Spirochaetales bacterium]|nr:type II toxin-antitoxin system RelE/ParE family toxin [Spirochaetales bacterium]